MLIIFDCDGVLVDSEALAAEIFSDLLATISIKMSPQMCLRTFKGRTLDFCYAWLENHYERKLPANFSQRLKEKTDERFGQELSPVAGIFDVLDYLQKQNVSFCVASNGGHKKIVNSLRATGLLDYFPNRFSAEDVAEGKPHPALFLHAAKRMKVPASDTIVIEDSYSGYSAALAANMRVLLFAEKPLEEVPNARFFNTMSTLITLLP